jgi:hypothetical protein
MALLLIASSFRSGERRITAKARKGSAVPKRKPLKTGNKTAIIDASKSNTGFIVTGSRNAWRGQNHIQRKKNAHVI